MTIEIIIRILISFTFIIFITGLWMKIANKIGESIGLGEFIMKIFSRK